MVGRRTAEHDPACPRIRATGRALEGEQGASKVNRALSRGRALEILKNAVDESLDYVPIDRFGDKRSLAILLITNVLREAA